MKLKRRFNWKILFVFTIIIFILIGTFYFLGTNKEKSKVDDKKKIVENDYAYENPFPYLREIYQNDDIIAEVEISSLDFKELVVKGNDNDYYLTHDIQKNKDKIGTTFLDYRTKDIDKAKQINIYGHNSDYYDLPFGILENYMDEKFFNNHQEITLKTDLNEYSYKIFAISTIPKESDEHMIISYEEEDFINHINKMRENALFDTKEKVTKKDQILILQTCLFNPEKYLLLFAKKVQ